MKSSRASEFCKRSTILKQSPSSHNPDLQRTAKQRQTENYYYNDKMSQTSNTKSEGKHKSQMDAIFASSESIDSIGLGKEMMSLFPLSLSRLPSLNSADPLSLSHMPSVSSRSRSVSATFLNRVLASSDSMFGSMDFTFNSMDTPGFPPASDDAVDTQLVKLESEVPSILQSKEWFPDYREEYMDATERRSTRRPNVACSFTKMYEQALGNRAPPRPENNISTNDTDKVPEKKKKQKIPVSRRAQPTVKVYVERTEMDILMGRGTESNKWKGNKRYRDVVNDTKRIYKDCAKYEKTLLSQRVVDKMAEEGRRFIMKDKTTGKWFEVPNSVARRKAGQALREENTFASRKAKREKYRQRN